MNRKIRIRKAFKEDAISISGLMDQLGYEASSDLITLKLEEFSSHSYDRVFVAVDNEKVLGCISCHITSVFHKKGASGRITSLVIDESARGKGVGGLLVDAADKFFDENDCFQAEVTSGDHREDAHKFYEAKGYQVDKRRLLKVYGN